MIYLTGFMGSGKSTVAGKLAALLNIPWLDMDDEIIKRTGSQIKDIFAYTGERTFRMIEREVLLSLAAGENRIIATGGGAPINPRNRGAMKASGYIVHLRAGLDTLKKRVPQDGTRPLWNQDVEKLFAARQEAYEDADICIDTDNLNADEVAARIAEKICALPMPVGLMLGDRSYPIFIGQGIFDGIQDLIHRHLKPEGVFVLVDSKVKRLHGPRIEKALQGLRYHLKEVPEGEGSKSMAFLDDVLGEMLSRRMNRQWICLAIGGGVTGDLSGFAASIFMRGIPVVQVPTTLLAQVDASIGGKTGINHAKGKNLVGAFHQPSIVVCDTDFLGTLDDEQIKGGYAEVIKYGMIHDPELFTYMEGPDAGLDTMVRMCCRDKAYVVANDELEGGLRRILNFGHTIGHAVEQHMDFSIHHGAGVAFGMRFAIWLSHELGLLSAQDRERMNALIERYEIVPKGLQAPKVEDIRAALTLDKKSEGSAIHFVLSAGIGTYEVKRLALEDILDAYSRFLNGY